MAGGIKSKHGVGRRAFGLFYVASGTGSESLTCHWITSCLAVSGRLLGCPVSMLCTWKWFEFLVNRRVGLQVVLRNVGNCVAHLSTFLDTKHLFLDVFSETEIVFKCYAICQKYTSFSFSRL